MQRHCEDWLQLRGSGLHGMARHLAQHSAPPPFRETTGLSSYKVVTSPLVLLGPIPKCLSFPSSSSILFHTAVIMKEDFFKKHILCLLWDSPRKKAKLLQALGLNILLLCSHSRKSTVGTTKPRLSHPAFSLHYGCTAVKLQIPEERPC